MNRTALLALCTTALLATAAGPPAFVTSDPSGGWSRAGYYVHNNLWNAAKYSPCTSTLSAWSHDNWRVVTRMNNRTGDGAVKTYPNVHRDYPGVRLDAFESITSRFAETSPQVGIYNVAYDIWTNAIDLRACFGLRASDFPLAGSAEALNSPSQEGCNGASLSAAGSVGSRANAP